MPFQEKSIVEQRMSFVIQAETGTKSISALCRDFGISRPTGYRWLRRWRETNSLTELRDRSRKPQSSPNETDEKTVSRVIALRKERGWGAKKLHVLLLREDMQIGVGTINRILKREGLLRHGDAHQPALKRFQREHPNELWQMDFKGWFSIAEGKCFPLSIIDDYSRFAITLCPLESTEAHPTYDAVIRAMKEYGVPKAILMDHGVPWWNTNSSNGITWFTVQLMKQDIRIYNSAYRHPQTQGKVEAFHRTIGRDYNHRGGTPGTLEEATQYFADFVTVYNGERPHEGIGMACPSSLYQPSTKAYDPDPPDFSYPEEYEPVRANSQGSITYKGRRHFVAKPLANEVVGVLEVLGKLLVRYCNTWVREVDLATGETRAFTKPVHDGRYLQ